MERSDGVPIIDFSGDIAQSTRYFAGRERIFRRINDWLSAPQEPHVLLLTGEPGSGKTALASRLIQFSQGDVSPPDGMEYLGRDFLSAMHLCLARDSLKISPSDFTASLAVQLAARYPAYAQALVEQNSDGKVTLNATQNIEQVSGGQVTAINITTLNLGGVPPEEAFNRAVLAPLRSLFRESKNLRVVILIDGLDEALSYSGKPNIVSLLSHMGDLPAGLRFIFTSRQDDQVETAFLDADGLYLSANEFDLDNHADVALYIEGRLRDDSPLAERASQLTSAQVADLINAINGRADGNFRYVSFLLDSMALGHRSLTDLEGLPEGLDSLYYQSLKRIVEQGKYDWQSNYAPLMCILAVAQENVTLRQLQGLTRQSESMVRALRTDLQQFVIEIEPNEQQGEKEERYRIYHQSVIDFLQRPKIGSKLKPLTNRFYLPPDEGHEQFVAHYRALAPDWGIVNWERVDNYGLHHLPAHLAALCDHQDSRKDLYAVICKPYMLACRKRFGSFQFFAANVALAIDVAGSDDPPDLVQVIRSCLIYSTLGVLATNIPPVMLGVLARLDRLDTALGFATLMQNREMQSQAYRLVGEALLSEQKVKDAKDALEYALKAAGGIAENGNGNKVFLLTSIALALLHSGEKELALEAVHRAVTTAEAMGYAHLRSVMLCDIAWQLVKSGEQSLALDLAKRSQKVAEKIEGIRIQAFALGKLAALWAKAGEKEQAEEAANHVVDLLRHEFDPMKAGGPTSADDTSRKGADATPQAPPPTHDQLGEDTDHGEDKQPYNSVQLEKDHSAIGDDDQLEINRVATVKDDDSTPWPPGFGPGQTVDFDFISSFTRTAILWVQQKWIQENSWNRQSVLNDIIKCLTLATCYEQALAVANLIGDDESMATALGIIYSTLVENGDQDIAKRVAEMAFDRLQIMDNLGSRVIALSFIVEMLLKGQDKDRAQEVVNVALQILEMIAEDSDKVLPMSSTTQALHDMGDHDRAEAYASRVLEIAGTIEDGLTKGLIAQYLAHAEQFDKSDAIIEMMNEQDEKAVALSALSQVLAQLGEQIAAATAADKAADAMDALKAGGEHGFRQAEIIVNQVLLSLTSAKQFRQAVRVAETISNEYVKVVAKSNIAQSMIDAHQQEQALATMNQVLASQLIWSPADNAIALGKLALQLAKQGKQEQAQAIAREIVEQAPVIRDEWFMIRALLQAIDVLTLIGQFELALTAAESIQSAYWKALALSKLVQVGDLTNTTRVLGAFEAATKAVLQKSPGDKWDKTWSLCDIASHLAQAGQYASVVKVLGLADTIDEKWDMASVPSRLGNSLPFNADENLTWLQVEVMGDYYWTAFLFLTDNVVSSRMALFDMFLNQAVEIGYIWKKAYALSKVGSILTLLGDQTQAEAKFAKAIELAQNISEQRTKVVALGEVAQILAQAARVDLAKDAVTQALSTMETLGESGYRLRVLNSLAGALIQIGERSQAIVMATRAIDIAKKIGDMYLRALTLNQAVILLAQAGEVDSAFSIAQEIGYVPNKLNALATITVEIARTTDTARALGEVESIPDEGTQSQVRGDMAMILATSNQFETAQRVMLAALTSARRAGRAYVWDVLDRGVSVLNAPGQEQLPWRIYEAIKEVENWWWS